LQLYRSAFAPDFQELEDNEPYIEREDELDLPTVEQKEARRREEGLDIKIDILTVEKTPLDLDGEAPGSIGVVLPAVPSRDYTGIISEMGSAVQDDQDPIGGLNIPAMRAVAKRGALKRKIT
jgi:hypothetical protein